MKIKQKQKKSLKKKKIYLTIGKKGFTLIEILLVIALIAILIGIVVVAINPGKQLADARNIRRQSDAMTILDSIQQYAIDHNGGALSQIPTVSPSEICKKDPIGSCDGLIDLAELTKDRTYIITMPEDPDGSNAHPENGTGYFVIRSATDNRVTVSAPQAERNIIITYSK